eukprot:scaffold76282_cov35-Prasinocladus_malaysianus.AAC.1
MISCHKHSNAGHCMFYSQDEGIANAVDKAIDFQGHMHRYYARERKTVWGRVMQTPVMTSHRWPSRHPIAKSAP